VLGFTTRPRTRGRERNRPLRSIPALRALLLATAFFAGPLLVAPATCAAAPASRVASPASRVASPANRAASPANRVASPATSAAPAGVSAEDLVRAVEKRYAAIRTLSANFTQTFRSGELSQSVTERGRLFVRRPGQMRWDYREPEKKIFLVEPGGTTLSYLPADLRAIRSRLPSDAPHLDLLMGQSDLLQSFAATEVTLKDPAFPGSRAVKLVPRRPIEGIEMVYLEIEPRMMTVERVLVLDPMGNESDLVLDRVVENAAVKADVFDVRIPAGVSVQDATADASR
jgi:outer membrane lipoprotein carrier protein